ncbi:unnamed protein product, partial [Didymodactylos carnosus]
MRGPL